MSPVLLDHSGAGHAQTLASIRKVILTVCTFRRNVALMALLETVAQFAQTLWSDVQLGITVVDDSPERHAFTVIEQLPVKFPLGLSYIHSGARNISQARNLGLEDAMMRGDWIAMTDDDCIPDAAWLPELLRVQAATGAEVATGLMRRRAPSHAPAWIRSQPFLELGEFDARDESLLTTAFTNNCLISSKMLREHPDLRFNLDFGKIGGEDMVFFRALPKRGLRIAFAEHAFVYEDEPEERLTLRYQFRRYFWHGNSSALTSLHNNVSRFRVFMQASKNLMMATSRPLWRLINGLPPQFAFAFAALLEAVGKLCGVFGIRVKHT